MSWWHVSAAITQRGQQVGGLLGKNTFDDHRLVANAGLLLPVTLAQRLGLGELVDSHVDLWDAPGRANTGDKTLILVPSALAGGDCINAANVLRTRAGRLAPSAVR